VPNREFTRYGGVQMDAGGRVTGFVRRGPSAAGSFHYIGVQAAAGRAFDAVRPGEAASSIGGVYDALIASQPGAVRGVVTDAEFWDVGTPADYWRTSNAFLAREGAAGPTIGRRARIDPTARITRSILWDDVEVGPDAVVDECIVTDRVRVPAGAAYRRAVLIHGSDDQPLSSPLSLES
jgi:NDP-sugar pyrophosphorylase family protein